MAFQTKTYKAPNKLQKSHSSRSPVNTGHTDHTSWSSARERTFKGQGLKRRAEGLKWSNTPVLRSLPRGEGDQARMLQLSTENGLSKQFCMIFAVFLWFKVLYAFKKLGDFAGRSLAWSPGRSTWVSGKKITSDAKTELRWREKWKAVAESTVNPGVMGMILCEWKCVYHNSFCRSTKVSSPTRPFLWSFQKKRFLDLWKSTKGMKNPAVGKFNCPRNYVTPRLRALLVACATHRRSALAELLWRHHTWQTVQLKKDVNVYDQLPSNCLLSFWNQKS